MVSGCIAHIICITEEYNLTENGKQKCIYAAYDNIIYAYSAAIYNNNNGYIIIGTCGYTMEIRHTFKPIIMQLRLCNIYIYIRTGVPTFYIWAPQYSDYIGSYINPINRRVRTVQYWVHLLLSSIRSIRWVVCRTVVAWAGQVTEKRMTAST